MPDSAAASDAGSPIAENTVDQAIAWYVHLASGQASPHDHAAFDRWLAGHGEHERAWLRVQGLGERVRGTQAHVQPAVARSVLRSVARTPSRRQAMKALAWAGIAAPTLYLAQRQLPWRNEIALAFADHRTATGERRNLRLPDGTQLMLNTATAVDVRYGERERRIVLRTGEIHVATAHDAAGRPLVVTTNEGALVPVGTRFTVRRDVGTGEKLTRVAVTEGAVDVRPSTQTRSVRVAASQELAFSAHDAGSPAALDEAHQAWTDGVLVAAGTPLAAFVAELARYRPGHLRCAPEVAHLRITGTWPLGDGDPTERILASLERQLPVRIDRVTRYWVTVRAR